MNCTRAEHLLLAARDGPPPSGEAGPLQDHLADCAACRRLREDLQAGFAAWTVESAALSVPDADDEWRAVRARRRDSRRIRPSTTWLRIGLPLATAAALAFLLVRPPWKEAAPALDSGNSIARVNFVEPGNAGASTLVYEDRESGWLVIWAADVEPALDI